jgi:hypothetical protein
VGDNRAKVDRRMLNYLDKGMSAKEELEGLMSVAARTRMPSPRRSTLYAAVLEENAEVMTECPRITQPPPATPSHPVPRTLDTKPLCPEPPNPHSTVYTLTPRTPPSTL